MRDFKIGDKVRLIDDSGIQRITKNNIYEVESVDGAYILLVGKSCYYFKERFVLVNPPGKFDKYEFRSHPDIMWIEKEMLDEGKHMFLIVGPKNCVLGIRNDYLKSFKRQFSQETHKADKGISFNENTELFEGDPHSVGSCYFYLIYHKNMISDLSYIEFAAQLK